MEKAALATTAPVIRQASLAMLASLGTDRSGNFLIVNDRRSYALTGIGTATFVNRGVTSEGKKVRLTTGAPLSGLKKSR